MSVLDITPVKNHVYTGLGVYEFDFKTYLSTDLVCTVLLPNGSTSTLVKDTDYEVDIAAEPLIGGSIEIILDTYSTATRLTISREVPVTQTIDWENGGPLDQTLITRAMDKLTMIAQQIKSSVEAVTTTFNWRGDWSTGVSYVSKDLVEGADDNWYYCTINHTSGVFATDLASGVWVLLIERSDLVALVADAAASEAAAEAAADLALLAKTAAEEAAKNTIDMWADNPTSYDTGDLAAGSDGFTYRSIVDSNVGNDPTADDGTNWTRLNGLPITSAADGGKTLRIDGDGKVVAEFPPIVDSLLAIGDAGTTETLDTVSYDTFTLTCDETTLDLSATTIATGRTITLILTGADTCTITWPTGIKWPGGSAPTFSSGTDRVVMQRVSSTVIHASLAGAEYA